MMRTWTKIHRNWWPGTGRNWWSRWGLSGANRKGQRGLSATLLLAFAVPLLLVASSLLQVVVFHQDEADTALQLKSAELIAFSGAQEMLARLNEDRTIQGTFQIPIDTGTAVVSVRPWGLDGIDNDEDGIIDDSAEDGFYEIQSVGWVNAQLDLAGNLIGRPVPSYRGETLVVAREADLDLNFGSAIYIDDPAAALDLNGGAFLLSGNDTDPDGSAGGESSRPAIGVNGDPQGIIDQIAGNQQSNIVGANPPIGQTSALDPDWYSSLFQPLAEIRWSDPSSYSGAIGDYQNLVGTIAYAEGDLHLHGNTSGAGVLFVEGDLVIGGHFEYAGVIFVRGNVTFQGGGGEKDLNGALVLWGEGTNDPDDLSISGSVEVEYSSSAVSMASLLGGVEVALWLDR